MRPRAVGRLAACVTLLMLAGIASAGPVRRTYRTAPERIGLPSVAYDPRYQNAADLVLEQSIRNLPLHPAASSAYTWRWNPQTDQLERIDDMVSPLFTERGQTLGRGLLNVGVTFGYYQVEDGDGAPLGVDPVPLAVQGAPIQYAARTDLTYSVSTFNITYGVRDDLDVNVAIPIVTLDMDLGISGRLRQCCAARTATEQVGAANLSDMLVRTKWRVYDGRWDGGPLAAAVGARVRLPTGDTSRGLGTGYGEMGPFAAVSAGLIPGWLDTHLDGGIDAVITGLRRSGAHYSWALDVHAPRGAEWWRRVALDFQVLGRSDFVSWRATPSIAGPHVTAGGIRDLPYLGFPARRRDYADAAFGVRVQLMQSLVLSLGVYKALNDAGVRADGWSPVASFEGTF